MSFLAPSALFWGTTAWLTAAATDGEAARSWWNGLDEASKGLIGLAAAVALVIFALILQQLVPAMTRIYAGAWPAVMEPLTGIGRRRQERAWRSLGQEISQGGEQARARAHQARYDRYPPQREQLAPTALGNVFQAAQSYPSSPHLYGMDAAFFWPRLYPVLPDSMRAELVSARTGIDTALVTATMFGAGGVVIAVLGGAAGLSAGGVVAAVVASWVLARVCYRWAVRAAVLYGVLVRAAFDVGRRPLMQALGLPLPGSLDEERRMWRAWGQLLYRGGVDESLEGQLRLRPEM